MLRILILLSFLLFFFNCESKSSEQADTIEFGESLYFLNTSTGKPSIKFVINRESSDSIKFESLLTLRNQNGDVVQLKTLNVDIVSSITIKNFAVEPEAGFSGDKVVKTIEIKNVSLNNKSSSITKTIQVKEESASLASFIEFGDTLYLQGTKKVKLEIIGKIDSSVTFKGSLKLRNAGGDLIQLKTFDFTIGKGSNIEEFAVQAEAGFTGDKIPEKMSLENITLNGVLSELTQEVTLKSQ